MNIVSRLCIGPGVAAAARAASKQAITFFEHDNFLGHKLTTSRPVGDFTRFGFNDRASSVVVRSGTWALCVDARFSGRCVVLRPGRYVSLSAICLNDRISSVRPSGGRPRPPPPPPYPPG
jgi:hypothetical protein